jgi:hypothetical protein
MKSKGLTRRQLGAAAAALPALAQNAPAPAKPADETEAARASARQAATALRNFKISATLEPSFVFKA